ncbi:unnamed protein product [Bemisia tabaci]|uniref:Major facilitator superfamily (MFS) profile domain-containing protein n=1 Tax=Bemisia tabaci TaxID=7038 RepID=A0A9P0F921_BEMTA|nr:unnamed protein product [Bemisia tabaci]
MMDPAGEAETITWNCWLRTIIAGSTTLLLYSFVGMNEGTANLLLSQMKGATSLIHLSQDQETWVASLGILSAPIAAILIGPFIDAFGRKRGVLLFYLNMGLGWAVIASAREVTQIYIGRIICAFGEGFQACAVVYLTEICTKEQRSVVLACLIALFSGGVLFVSVVNTCLPWPMACSAFSLASFALAGAECFVPESPAWLFSQGEEAAAVRNLQKLGRSKAGVLLEIDALKERESCTEVLSWRTFLRPTVWKPFLILAVFHLLQFSTGFYDMIYYQVDYLERLGTKYDPIALSVAFSTVRFLSNATIGIYFRSLDRKFSTTVSGLCMTVPLLGAGIYEFKYWDTLPLEKPFQWLLLFCIFAQLVAGNLSVTCLPWSMGAELYPLNVRGIMSGATLCVAYSIFFTYVKLYHVAMGALKMYGLLFVFAASSFLAALFGIFILPETRGKSLSEIERGFEAKARKVDQQHVVDTRM